MDYKKRCRIIFGLQKKVSDYFRIIFGLFFDYKGLQKKSVGIIFGLFLDYKKSVRIILGLQKKVSDYFWITTDYFWITKKSVGLFFITVNGLGISVALGESTMSLQYPCGAGDSAFTQRGTKRRVYGWMGWDGWNIKSVLQISLYFLSI